MKTRAACLVVAVLMCLPLQAISGAQRAKPEIPNFNDGTWFMEAQKRCENNASFVCTRYGRPLGPNKKEGGMSLRFEDSSGEEVLKSWGVVFVNDEENPAAGYNALLLDNNTWAISIRGKGYSLGHESDKGEYFSVITVFTEEGERKRAFPIKHAV